RGRVRADEERAGREEAAREIEQCVIQVQSHDQALGDPLREGGDEMSRAAAEIEDGASRERRGQRRRGDVGEVAEAVPEVVEIAELAEGFGKLQARRRAIEG